MPTTASRTTGNGSVAETGHADPGTILMPFSGRPVSRTLLVTAVLALLMGACSSSKPTANETQNPPQQDDAPPTSEVRDPGPASDDEPDSTSSSDPAPLVGLSMRLSEGNALFLLRSQETLVSRCMAERGFLYREPDIPDDALKAPPRRWTPVYP